MGKTSRRSKVSKSGQNRLIEAAKKAALAARDAGAKVIPGRIRAGLPVGQPRLKFTPMRGRHIGYHVDVRGRLAQQRLYVYADTDLFEIAAAMRQAFQ